MGMHVIAIDSGAEKKKMCLEQLGASSFVDFAESKNVVKDVQAATEDGLGPHAVILVAVNEKPFQQAAEVLHPPLSRTKHYIHTDTLPSTSAHAVQSSASVCQLAHTSRHPSSSQSSRWSPSRAHTSATERTRPKPLTSIAVG